MPLFFTNKRQNCSLNFIIVILGFFFELPDHYLTNNVFEEKALNKEIVESLQHKLLKSFFKGELRKVILREIALHKCRILA